jgi:hypothetical protein
MCKSAGKSSKGSVWIKKKLDHLDAKVDDVVEIKIKRMKKKRKVARSKSEIIG